jgi:hypothetical protein
VKLLLLSTLGSEYARQFPRITLLGNWVNNNKRIGEQTRPWEALGKHADEDAPLPLTLLGRSKALVRSASRRLLSPLARTLNFRESSFSPGGA